MDDLEFIKKHVQVDEGIVFNDCGHMLRSLLSEVVEAHLQAEAEDPHSDLTDMLADIVRKYTTSRVR